MRALLMTDPAADPLLDLASAGQDAASAIDSAFAKAAESLTLSLTKAAASGKLSLATLAQAALEAVDALAKVPTGGGASGQGLGDALAGVIGSAFSGAKADGGPVAPGGAYLVGERGPELFTPASAGDIGGAGGGGLTVNMTVQGASDPTAFVRSEAQLAQALARATSLGVR